VAGKEMHMVYFSDYIKAAKKNTPSEASKVPAKP
jgi:hypothetical protein